MKIILSDLTMTKVYGYKLLDKTVENGYINYGGTAIQSDANARTFKYDVSGYKTIKIVSEDNKNISPTARFVDGNDALIGSKITYATNTETELQIPSDAVGFQITDTYNNRSNVVSVYGKKA